MEKRISTPLTDEVVENLRVGDKVLITGYIYTARDAAHKRMVEALQRGEPLPIDVKGQIIYYVGPTPPKPGQVIGSAGPTTSIRMDKYVEELLKLGLKGMIGKGYRSPPCKRTFKKVQGCILCRRRRRGCTPLQMYKVFRGGCLRGPWHRGYKKAIRGRLSRYSCQRYIRR